MTLDGVGVRDGVWLRARGILLFVPPVRSVRENCRNSRDFVNLLAKENSMYAAIRTATQRLEWSKIWQSASTFWRIQAGPYFQGVFGTFSALRRRRECRPSSRNAGCDDPHDAVWCDEGHAYSEHRC